MTEIKQTLETLPLAEALRPDVTPEMGFQSYELLAGDTAYRKAQQADFMAGKIRNPRLDYPLLDERKLRNGIAKLDTVLMRARTVEDDLASDAIWDSASYRMAEMYWLLQAKRLNELADNPDSPRFQQAAERYQELNEQLYSEPNPELTTNVYGEILAQADAKDLHPSAAIIHQELLDGFSVDIDGEEVSVPGIRGKEGGRLPQDVKETLAVLREVLYEDFADVHDLVSDYWDNVVLPRARETGEEPGFNIHDMKALFTTVHNMRDPDNSSGINIDIHPGSTQLAWDTPTMSVRIGEGRKPITDVDDMFGKIIHEYGRHGLPAVNGLKTDLPVLGTGVYSDAYPGENPDYLTFEEGHASLCEIAVDDSFTNWKPMHISRYLAAASLYEGNDFRQAFEINWRARVLMACKTGQEVTDKMVEKEKNQAYLSVTRISRGTPTQLVDGPVLTFNKDLAYLEGKIRAMSYLESVGNDKAAIRRLFLGKFDPTNHRQNQLAERYIDTKIAQE